MMRVVYLSCIPLSAKVARDWYIDHLLDSGVDLQFWDITQLLRGKVNEHHQQQAAYVRELDALPLLEQAIIAYRDAVFVLLVPKTWQFKSVFRLLSRHLCKTAIVKWGAMPSYAPSSRNTVLHLLRSPYLLLSKIKNRCHAFLLNSPRYGRRYDLVFAAGQVMLAQSGAAAKTVAIGLCDYDQYTLACSSERLVASRYAVFLDIYLPYQSDLPLVGMQAVNPATYFAALHRFFSLIESRYGLEVVIATHPKARYLDNEYRGRKLIHGKTPELVKDAELVLCHASTSVSYAVLNRKPLWLIYTDEMARLYEQNFMRQIRNLAAYLKTPLLNATQAEQNDLPPLEPPNEEAYANYQRDFIVTPDVTGGQSKEIFLRALRALAHSA
ncbi:MAG: hypothetical protein V4623_02450 [Pseudomonadota bacterium]